MSLTALRLAAWFAFASAPVPAGPRAAVPATLRSARFLRSPSGRGLSDRVCEKSIPPELPALEEGWKKFEDDDGAPYYNNAETKVSVWEPPWKLPPNWAEFDDDGKAYFHNSEIKATIWDRPWILPEGWKEYADADGKLYFNNAGTTGTTWARPFPIPLGWEEFAEEGTKTPYFFQKTLDLTTWDRPWPLPAGWLICKDADGEVYYADEATNDVQWDRPLLGEFAPDPTQAPVKTTAAPATQATNPIPAPRRGALPLFAVGGVGAAILVCTCLPILIKMKMKMKKRGKPGTSSSSAKSQSPAPEAPVQGNSAKDRIAELQSMLDGGLITEDQFKAKKQAIIHESHDEPQKPTFGGVNALGIPVDSTVESNMEFNK